MPEFPELPGVHELTSEADEHRQHRFTRLVAVAIVLTTLAAATTAFLQAGAIHSHDGASALATKLATQAVSSRHLTGQAANMLVSRHGLAEQQRTRAASAQQQAFFGPPAQRAELAAERRRWLSVTAQTLRNTAGIAAAYDLEPVVERTRTGPDQDRFFPQGYLAGSRREAYRLGALRDGANEKAHHAATQIGRFAISLTLFAVAVFLFGYSLTPHARRRRRLFAGVATLLATIGTVAAVITSVESPHLPPEGAADSFAAGRVAYDSQDYELAVREFTRSLEAWPEYASAYTLRAKAHFAAGSPQLEIAQSLTTDEALEAAAEDEAHAIELGSHDSGLLTDHGFHLFALGLKHDDDAEIEHGLHYSEEAMEARPTDPVPAFNVAVSLLALDHAAEAREVYAEAVERTVYADEEHRERRDDAAIFEVYLGEALTDLELLAKYRGDRLGEEIERVKLQIVAPITRAAYDESLGGQRRQDAAAEEVPLEVGPGFTQFRIVGPRNIPDAVDLSAQWYYDTPGGLGWQVLAPVSGAVNAEVALETDGTLVHRAGWLARTGSCLSPGRYRLDLYVNGRIIARPEVRADFPRLTAARLRGLRLAICRPEGWRPVRGRAPGLLDGYESADGRAGTLVFSVSRAAVGAQRPSVAFSRRIMDAALDRFAGRLPAGLTAGRDVERPFMDLEGKLVRAYRYPGGRALVAAGAVANSDQLLVAVTFGPGGFVSGDGRAVFASVTREAG